MVNNYFGIYVQALLEKDSVSKLQTQLNKIKDLQVKVTPTFGEINTSQISKISSDLKTQLSSLTEDAKNVDITPNINTETLKKVSNGYTLVKESLAGVANFAKQTGESFNILGNASTQAYSALNDLVGTVGKVAVWSIATNAIFGTKHALEDLFNTYVELENQLVSIERVSTNFDMSQIFEGAYESSQKYGASLTDMLASVEEISRSYGTLTEQETLAAAQAGILASTVADMNGEDAVQGIIAVSNAYGFAIENGQLLIDMANEVDNNFSVSSETIITAWEKSAATAKTFGVEVENLTGYITAISTVTQESGETIGNSLKTIFSRITTMDSAISAIKSAGVDVFDPITNEARDVQDVLADLAGSWETLSDTQKQTIGVQVAGRYQLTRFLALMNNYSIVTDATTSALSSQGSAAKENEKYLESYQAKLTQLENAQVALSESINNSSVSGLGKTFLDLKVTVTEVAAEYFKFADATAVAVVAGFSFLTILAKTENGAKLLTNTLKFLMSTEQAEIAVKNLSTSAISNNTLKRWGEVLVLKSTKIGKDAETKATIEETIATLSNTTAKEANIATTGALSVAQKIATVGAITLSAALNLIPFVAIATAIGALVTVTYNWLKANKKSSESLKEQNNNINTNKLAIIELANKYEEARAAKISYESGNITDVEDYNSLLENEAIALQNLAEQYPALKESIEDENISWAEKKRLIEEANKVANEASLKELENSKNAYEATKKEIEQTYEQINLKKQLKDLNPENTIGDTGLVNIRESTSLNTTRVDTQKENAEALENSKDKLTSYIDNMKSYYEAIGEVSTVEKEWINRIKDLGLANANTSSELGTLDNVISQFIQEASEGKITTEGFEKALSEIGFTQEEINNIMSDYANVIDNTTDSTEDYTKALDTFNKSCDDVIDSLFGLQDGTTEAVDNMVSLYNISSLYGNYDVAEKINSMADSFEFLGMSVIDSSKSLEENMSMVQAVADTLKIAAIDEEAYAEAAVNGTLYVAKGKKALMEQVVANHINELKTQKDSIENEIANIKSKMQAEKISAKHTRNFCSTNIENLKTEASAYVNYANTAINALKAVNTAKTEKKYSTVTNKATKNYSTLDLTNDYSSQLSDLESQLASVNTQITSWSNIKVVETTVSGFQKIIDATKSASESTKTYYETLQEGWKVIEAAISGLATDLKILEEQQKNLTEGSSEWFDNLNKQKNAIDKQKQAVLDYIVVLKRQLYSGGLTAEQVVDLNNVIKEQTLEYEKLNTALGNVVETEEEYYKSQIENKLELIKDLEEERHNQVLDNIKTERDAFKKQIDEQLSLLKKASAARTYEKELGELQEQRLEILSKISRLEGDSSRLAKSQISDLTEQLKDVESQIEDLNYERGTTLREEALDDLSTAMDDYYDNLETEEESRNEAITESIDTANENLDNIDYSLGEIINQLSNWSGILSNFDKWTTSFDTLIGSLSSSNVISTTVPLTTENANGTTTTTQLVLNITGSKQDANDIADTTIAALKASGLIK